jgi:hypothetical protein
VKRFFFAFSLVGACACSSPENPEEERCASSSSTQSVPGALAMGSGDGDSFVAYTDGQEVEIVQGSQGGYMIVPSFRIDTSLIATDGYCSYIDITATVEGEAPSLVSVPLPRRTDSETYFYVPDVFVFLSSTLSGIANKPCDVIALFRDEGLSTRLQIRLELLPP